MTRLLDRLLFCVALTTFLILSPIPGSVMAQVSGTGVITGQVTDQSGAVVPGTQVTITQQESNVSQTTTTNAEGRYTFSFVQPGTYDVTFTKQGFSKARVLEQQLIVGGQVNANVTLKVGAITQIVEVTQTPGANLQTMNATMGTSLSGSTIMKLPTLDRDAAALLTYEPTAAPSFHGVLSTATGENTGDGNIVSGQVAGAQSDQNTYLLDGGNNTDDLSGDNAYIDFDSNGNNFSGSPKGAIPVPVESVEEFRINTNNMTADFASASGAQVLLSTKRGIDTFHGSGYDFFQSGKLDSNSWDNNFNGTAKPNQHSDRFGFDVGGPMLPAMLGGKTYFYFFYEGNRYPRAGPYEALVPTDTLRNGIVTLNGVQYDLATAKVCGPSGNLPCDPRGIGINPTIQKLWTTYEPEPNFPALGDGANVEGYRANLNFPLSDNYIAGRIDHDFGSKWRWFSSYRWFRESNLSTTQVDIGGLLPGDKLGVPAAAANNPNQPRYFVIGLTGTITPTLTNEFHFSYTRNNWEWKRAGALPQISGIPAALEPGGESMTALVPIDIRTQDARRRLWDGHDWDYRDTMSWVKGTHLFQFGGEALHQWLHFDRYDNVVGGLTSPVYNIGDGAYINGSGTFASPNMLIGPDYQPAGLPSNLVNTWDGYYATLLGMVYDASVVVTRTGANLTPNPLGSPLATYDTQDVYNLYFSDTWRVRPNWTFNYGLNWGVQLAPVDKNGEQTILVDSAGNPVVTDRYLANVLRAADAGQIYNPTLGFEPIGNIKGMKYPYSNFYGQFAPRVSVAYSPNWSSGWLGKLFGNGTTVIRGGYSRIYDRNNAINAISNTTLGDGFLQSVSCTGVTTTLACLGTNKVDPNTAFRIGIDGNSVPLTVTPTLDTPVEPGVNAPYAILANSQNTIYQPGVSDVIDFSIQKQFKGNTILEVGYVGRWMEHLYEGKDLANVPWMTKLGGQTFAQAYDNLYSALSRGQTPAAQPFLETALAGSSYCGGFSSCTAAVAANESSNILTQSVTSMWSDLDSSWTAFGPALASTNQCFYCFTATSDGYGNYQAFIVSVEKRATHGLTLVANLTYGHALATNSYNQTFTITNPANPWDLRTDYGQSYFDRKFVTNILGTYDLPFGSGQHWSTNSGVLNRIMGGWSFSPIFTWASGLPLGYYDGTYQEYGNAFSGVDASMIPMVNTRNLSNSVHSGITPGANVGANGIAGLNLFSNPSAVFNQFRPPLLGIDGRSMDAGQLRGQTRWGMDLGITKETRITERVDSQIFIQAFNVFNHVEFQDPLLVSSDPGDFGVPYNPDTGLYQLNTLNGQYTRVIQLGVRFSF